MQENRYSKMSPCEILRDRLETRYKEEVLREMYAKYLYGKNRLYNIDKVPEEVKRKAKRDEWEVVISTLVENWGKFWTRKS